MTIYSGPYDVDAIIDHLIAHGLEHAAAEFATIKFIQSDHISVVLCGKLDFKEKNWGAVWIRVDRRERAFYLDWFDDGWRLPADPAWR